ncbi:MAG TPA: choice-of-anchor Q domain-containing protein [Actinomycetota bacterium]|nr:choice-of-anchor Q domain-containing protein [Actinomycetota bacterium]
MALVPRPPCTIVEPLAVTGSDVHVDGEGTTITGGGTIFDVAPAAKLFLEDVTISGSRDAAIVNHGELSVSGVTFSNNDGLDNGGAIFSDGIRLTVTNSTFSANHARNGGAIYSTGADFDVTNSTFVGNTAGAEGGAIDYEMGAAIRNSIFHGNKAPDGGALAGGGPATLHNSLVAEGGCLTDPQISASASFAGDDADGCGSTKKVDPPVGLAPLGDNGGPTWTAALETDSPALSAGDPVTCPDLDQRGALRKGSDGSCDIGAYEATRASIVDTVSTREGSDGCTHLAFPVALDTASPGTVTVEYEWDRVDDPCGPNKGKPSGESQVTFDPGDLSQTIAIGTTGDDVYEPTSGFSVDLIDASNGVLTHTRSSKGEIVNDDSAEVTPIPRPTETPTSVPTEAPSPAPTTAPPSASPAPPTDTPTPTASTPATVEPTPSGEPTPSPGAGPDLFLRDVTIELIRGSGAVAAGSFAAAPADDSLRILATVANKGDAASPPTWVGVATKGWTGEQVPVGAIPAGATTRVDGSMPAPPGVTKDTTFVVTIGPVEGEHDPFNNAKPDVAAVVPDEGGTSPITIVVVVLAGAAVVTGGAVAVTQLLHKRPSLHRIHSSQPEPPSPTKDSSALGDVADRYLGAERGPPLWDAGPASAHLRDEVGDDERAAPLIATMFWRALIATPRFVHALQKAGASGVAVEDPDVLVIAHAEGTRHDLLVLDPGFSAAEPGSVFTEPAPEELADAWDAVSRREQVTLRGVLGGLPSTLLKDVLREVAAYAPFGITVVARPKRALTGCPSPPWPIGAVGEAATSTAGAAVVDPNGRIGVTVADHAIRGYEKVMVDGRLGTVISSDAISDSGFVEVSVDDPGGARGEKGPLSGVTPRQMEVVEFDGIRSGRSTTRIVGWDPTILTIDSYIQNKIVTDPVTMQGDSGAALVDRDGYILGFAFYTTALDAHPAHSGWIWADSVYRAHRLLPRHEA